MSPSESEDDTKKTGSQPEPLCLFCFPNKDDTPPDGYQDDHQKTYIEAAPKEETKKEFLTAAIRRKMQHSTPRKPEPAPAPAPAPTLRPSPDKKSKRRSPSRRRLAEMMKSTDSSNESQERKKPQSYAEYKKNYHRQKTGRESVRRKKKEDAGARKRDEMWLRRRRDTGMKGRRQGQEPVRHLKSYLLSSVKDDKVPQKGAALPLIEVLETIKDAWPPPTKTLTLESRAESKEKKVEEEMKTESSLLFPQPLLNRRFSMPEEVMRKYSVTKERTSEESETNKTMPEITSPSSKEPDETLETEREVKPQKSEKMSRRKSILRSEVFSKTIDEEDIRTRGYDASVSGKDTGSVYSKRERTKTERSFIVLSEVPRRKEEFKSSDEEIRKEKPAKRPITRRVSVVDTTTKRVTQNEYYNQGKGIIKVKAMEKGSQTNECTCRSEKAISSTTASAKEESDESHSSKSLSSRSPEQLPKGEDESSDNLSSESDYIECTCAELTSSKETSSDMFASGKSTLSQTVSDKSESTQDSTISIRSVPTEGSSVSAESNSTSPELDPKTSAKETTTSPDHTPRTPRSRNRPFRLIKDQSTRQESFRPRDVKPERKLVTFPVKKCPVHTAEEFTSNGKDEEEYPSDSAIDNGYGMQRQSFPEDLYNLPDRNLDPNPLSYRDSDERKELEIKLKRNDRRKRGDEKPLKHPQRRDEDDDDEPPGNVHGRNPDGRSQGKENRERDRSQGSKERKQRNQGNTRTSKRTHNCQEEVDNYYDQNAEHDESPTRAATRNTAKEYDRNQENKGRKQQNQENKADTSAEHEVSPNRAATRNPAHSERDRSQGSKERKQKNQENNPRTPKRSHTYPEDTFKISIKNAEHDASPNRTTARNPLSNERDRSQESKERKSKPQANNPTPSQTYPEDIYNIPHQNPEHDSSLTRPSCPIHRPKDESPVRSVRFEPKCTDNRNCSTPIQNDPPVPKIDLSGDASSTPKSERDDPKWAKLTQEEIYMIQQQHHRKFIENQRQLSNPLPTTPDKDSISACSANGSTYREAEDTLYMIPRYSALPRTLSMVVNTSSGDSVHDDSDNQSLADSLEEHPTTTVHKLYFDTKQEAKPVRGDASVLPEIENKFKYKEPRGRAFFVSINEPFGEGELLPSIDKIPEPPEKIKDRIYERHLKICKKHNKNLEIEKAEEERRRKEMEESLNRRNLKKEMKKEEKKIEEAQKTARVEKKVNRSLQTKSEKPKIEVNKRKLPRIKSKSSKIPVAVNSTSTSPERDQEQEKNKRPLKKLPKPRLIKERPKEPEEVPKKLEPTPPTVPKPQAVIHPSQMPTIDPSDTIQRRLSLISSLESTATILKLQPLAPPKPLIVNQTKRSPVMKFRQRFEVIPEERSSSLTSSAEERWSNEKNRRASLPVKLTETSTSPIYPNEQPQNPKPHFRRYSLESLSNLIIAKLMGKPLQAISCVQRGPNNENQQIIVLSPKDALGPNGSSGDALLAMNREDFDRLSKGWMNFYVLKENSEEEDETPECRNGHCEKDSSKTYTLSDFQKIEKEVADVIQERSAKFLQDNTDKTDLESTKNVSKSYSIFLKSQEKTEEDVKTSEFVLIEKAENHELMCLNNKDEPEKEEESQKPKKEKKIKKELEAKKLDENVRFHCSNTILQTTKPIDVSPRNLSAKRRQSSLPELKVTTPKHPVIQKIKSSVEILPKVSGKPSDQDGMDSDSTVYFQPPNPKIPPLTLEGSGDFPSDGTFSTSSDSENETKAPIAPLPVKYLPLRKRGVSSRTRLKRETFYYDSPHTTKPDTGWTVTVAGTVELTRAAPDVEMRLSFPVNNNSRPPAASQSDSGFAEDANSSQNLDNPKLKKQSSTVLPPANVKQKWTVTVKKPCQGSLQEGNKLKTKKNYRLLPDLGQTQSRSSKKVLKNTTPRSEKDKETVERKLCALWPKVQEIIKNELGSHNARLVSELSKVYEDDLHLSVQGCAVPFEKKPYVPTNTERDLSRGLTSRSNRSKT